MKYSCGEALDFCRCRYGQVTVQRSEAELRAAHRAAVERAKRSGFATQPYPMWLYEMFNPGAGTFGIADPTGRSWAA